MANGNPSPGWYQDPRDPAQVRWWDGAGWTQNTQAMPGAVQPEPAQPEVAPEPVYDQPADPWAAAGQAPAQPEQQWGQAPAQPEQQWGQAPAQPEQQWGQAPAQPEQQWGQAPAQPEQQWGQAPAQPEQQWGQAPAQPEQQWGQAPAQPGAEGGWQQQQPGAWGSAVPPAPVPGGLAPGSPMGQTNVFPTSETVDPITGMPVAPADTGSKTSGKRLAALVGGTLLVGLLILGLLWFFLFRGSGSEDGATGAVDVTATFSGTVDPACADLGAALTADDLSNTVATRLNDVAVAKDLEENQAYFEQLGKDIQPIMDQYQSACLAAVSAGNAPEFYRTFVETFQASVTDGEAVATSALQNGGQVTPEEAERLRAEASKLQASSEAVIAVSGGPSPTASAAPEASPTAAPSESLPASPAPETVVPSAIG
ncbi:MAG: DUF2510 domain-containing protein [Actinobacteria bacterium]|nr:DUF2510 domain-containing protein [Actinomycetota bacterium]